MVDEPKRHIEEIHVIVVGDTLGLRPLSAFQKKVIRRYLEEGNGHIGYAVDRVRKYFRI
jgi:hypothetical protein